ncbi:MAG: Sec-independent protein translocase protein TatB [Pseudomonadota bacterium]
MFDLGWTELMVIGIVALIVVGPKDLPGMFRTVGNFVGKAKRMARDFSKAMNDAADDAGVGDVKRSLDAATNPVKTAMNEMGKTTESFTAQTMAGPKNVPKRAEMTPERQEMADKIAKRGAEVAEERIAQEAADAAEKAAPKPAKKPAKKPAAKKPAAKSTAKPAAKSTPKPKAAPKKTAAKPAAKKKTATKS